jgi:small redox-active disulfide protein 2
MKGDIDMRRIEVLGPGCDNCVRLEQEARQAIGMAGIEAEVVKATDYREIMAHGVLSTPGLVIDGKVMSVGRVPSAGDIADWLTRT